MDDLHEVNFEWPGMDATDVIVTGTFDQWSSSIHLTKDPSSFQGKVRIPWGEKIVYKFIVDGNWVTHSDHPIEADSSGNRNNVYTAPQKPE
ncbi:carbohydrate-binding module family 48 protein, partial [Serpula lacrymans var. lacrymans S7.3]